jgi:AbiV family abortive infection protein
MSVSVTPEYLLKGAVYALQQCGLLLRDANLLYRSGSYATALGLAAFAREELGRWRILLDLRTKALDGESITIEEIQSQCADHVRKQDAGMTSITMRFENDSGLGKLLETRRTSPPGSEERKAADKQVKKLDRQKMKRVPDDRHRQRMSALYVDAVPPDGWNRPVNEISQMEAHDFIQEAVNDYSMQFQRYSELELIREDYPELFGALAGWLDRPELARPEWPPYPT